MVMQKTIFPLSPEYLSPGLGGFPALVPGWVASLESGGGTLLASLGKKACAGHLDENQSGICC